MPSAFASPARGAPFESLAREALFERLALAHAGALTVLTPNRRLAAALARDFDDSRAAAGLAAWESADLLPWTAFVERLWDDILHLPESGELPVLLAPEEEDALWEAIVADSRQAKGLYSLAAAARLCREAHRHLHVHCLKDCYLIIFFDFVPHFHGNRNDLAHHRYGYRYCHKTFLLTIRFFVISGPDSFSPGSSSGCLSSLDDLIGFRISKEAFHRIFPRKSIGPKNLHCSIGRADSHLCSKILCRRDLDGVPDPLVSHPCSAVDQESCGLFFNKHLSNLLLNHLEARNWLAKLLARITGSLSRPTTSPPRWPPTTACPPARPVTRLYQSLYKQWAAVDPAAAGAKAAQIADKADRARVLETVASEWAVKNPSDAFGWVQSLPEGADRRAAVPGR